MAQIVRTLAPTKWVARSLIRHRTFASTGFWIFEFRKPLACLQYDEKNLRLGQLRLIAESPQGTVVEPADQNSTRQEF